MMAVSSAREMVGYRPAMDPYLPQVFSPLTTTAYAHPALRVEGAMPRIAPSVLTLPDTRAPGDGGAWMMYSRDGGGRGRDRHRKNASREREVARAALNCGDQPRWAMRVTMLDAMRSQTQTVYEVTFLATERTTR